MPELHANSPIKSSGNGHIITLFPSYSSDSWLIPPSQDPPGLRHSPGLWCAGGRVQREFCVSGTQAVCWSPCYNLNRLSFCTSHSKPRLTQFLSNSAKNTPAFCSLRRMRSALPQSGRLSVCFYWQFKDLSSFNIKCHRLFKVYFCVFIFPFTIINISSLFLKPMNNLHVITLYLRNGEIL